MNIPFQNYACKGPKFWQFLTESIEKAGRSHGLLYSYFSFGRSPHTCGSGYILGVATVASLVTNLLKRSLAMCHSERSETESIYETRQLVALVELGS